MPDHAPPKDSDLAKYVAIGLGWGVVAATVLMAGAMLVSAASEMQRTNGVIYVAIIVGTFVGALVLAIPAFPFAALMARPLYRRGVRSRIAYALAGAIAALLPFIAFQFLRGPAGMPEKIDVQFFWAAWFAASGAFGGFMAARALRANTN